ncbi:MULTISPECIES: DUF485 domain-containing protein [Bacillaceae]|uniref:DUF485 domain-containing protein n=1 Tax=Bacillaceae TaxID=186817 RepID=UPI0009EAF0C1|nr:MULTISPECIES: DUF485 domain-containing protein [Bacillaceae]MDF2067730.1 DUF485 domain-containing protein [Bacillus sp. Cr_A10]
MAKNLESVYISDDHRNSKTLSKDDAQKTSTNYTAIAQSPEFKELKRKKNRFILPMSLFFFVCYITLPILTSYTTILNVNAFGDVSWVWVYSIALFIMTWTLCMIYVRKANTFDQEANDILEKEKAGGYK